MKKRTTQKRPEGWQQAPFLVRTTTLDRLREQARREERTIQVTADRAIISYIEAQKEAKS